MQSIPQLEIGKFRINVTVYRAGLQFRYHLWYPALCKEDLCLPSFISVVSSQLFLVRLRIRMFYCIYNCVWVNWHNASKIIIHSFYSLVTWSSNCFLILQQHSFIGTWKNFIVTIHISTIEKSWTWYEVKLYGLFRPAEQPLQVFLPDVKKQPLNNYYNFSLFHLFIHLL